MSLRLPPNAWALILALLVACGSGPAAITFKETQWQRELPPGWEPEACTSGTVIAAATDLKEVLAAAACSNLRDMLEVDKVSGLVDTIAELEAKLKGPGDIGLAIDAWQVGADLQAQGALIHLGIGARYIEHATVFLTKQIAAGTRFNEAIISDIGHLALRDMGLKRAFEREQYVFQLPTGGCSSVGGSEDFSRAMDTLGKTLELPYQERWDTIATLDVTASKGEWLAWPTTRPFLDQITVVQGRARALALAVGAVRPDQVPDPITGHPIQYDRDRCMFVLAPTHEFPAVEVKAFCPQAP